MSLAIACCTVDWYVPDPSALHRGGSRETLKTNRRGSWRAEAMAWSAADIFNPIRREAAGPGTDGVHDAPRQPCTHVVPRPWRREIPRWISACTIPLRPVSNQSFRNRGNFCTIRWTVVGLFFCNSWLIYKVFDGKFSGGARGTASGRPTENWVLCDPAE